MACNNGNGNRAYQKSCVRYFNNSPQLLAADSTNVLTLAGAKVVNSGSSIQVEPQSYDTVKIGDTKQWNIISAANVLTMLPLIIMYFCCQKYFIEGISVSGIKQ